MENNNRILTFIIVAVLLIGAALAFVFVGRGEQPEQANSPALVEEVVVAEATLPATEIMEEAEPTQAEVEEAQDPPAPRTGLEATNPTAVNLASGDVQLVEVFAFW